LRKIYCESFDLLRIVLRAESFSLGEIGILNRIDVQECGYLSYVRLPEGSCAKFLFSNSGEVAVLLLPSLSVKMPRGFGW